MHALQVVDAVGIEPEVRHLSNSAGALLRPWSRLRPGPVRHRVVRPLARARRGHLRRARPGAGDDRPRPARRWSSGCPPGASVSYGHTWTAAAGHHRRAGAGRVRRRRAAARLLDRARPRRRRRSGWSRAGSAWTSSWSTSATTRVAAGDDGRAVRHRRATARRPRRTGPRPAAPSPMRSSPGSVAGSSAATSSSKGLMDA